MFASLVGYSEHFESLTKPNGANTNLESHRQFGRAKRPKPSQFPKTTISHDRSNELNEMAPLYRRDGRISLISLETTSEKKKKAELSAARSRNRRQKKERPTHDPVKYRLQKTASLLRMEQTAFSRRDNEISRENPTPDIRIEYERPYGADNYDDEATAHQIRSQQPPLDVDLQNFKPNCPRSSLIRRLQTAFKMACLVRPLAAIYATGKLYNCNCRDSDRKKRSIICIELKGEKVFMLLLRPMVNLV